jgi:two-component sensor histidine kinase
LAVDHPAEDTNSPERGSATEELQYRLQQQQLAAEFALFALQTHDVQKLLQEATRICAQGLQSQMCKVMEYLEAEGQFVVRAGMGWEPGVVGKARTGADVESPTGYAFQTGEPVISSHLHGEGRFRTPKLLEAHGVKRAINVLVRGGKERFGVLEVDSPVEGRFTEADLVFVTGFANLLGVALERQHIEESLKDKETRLQQALEHQKVLTKEISHRVKNSLTIVAGLLSLQSRVSSDDALKQALTEARARVQTITHVHDRLWRGDEVQTVDLSEFLGQLCEDLRTSAPHHELVYHVPSISVATDQAISLGLLINELVTNALKYAYPHGTGTVWVTVSASGLDELCMEVYDRGVGLPADFGSASSESLGKQVIPALSQQLGGRLEWRDAQPGTRVVVTFPRQMPANQP